MDGPQDEHLVADDRIGVLVAVGQDAGLVVRGQGGAEPGGHPKLRIGCGEPPLAVGRK